MRLRCFRAGVRPDDFWNMAPCESTEYLDEHGKAVLEAAWWAGRLYHVDPKKYPKTPRALWDNDSDKMTSNQLFNLALAFASNGAEVRKRLKEQGKL